MKKFSILILLSFTCSLVMNCKENPFKKIKLFPEKKSEFIKVNIEWGYFDLNLQMKAYEIKSQIPYEVWDTQSVDSIKSSPASIEIPDSSFIVQSGRYKEFLIGMENTLATPIYFFAAPHVVQPPQYSLGFKFKCLCINHAFTIPPGKFWYRIVRLNIDKDFRGDEFVLKHDLIGISEERMRDFEYQAKQAKDATKDAPEPTHTHE